MRRLGTVLAAAIIATASCGTRPARERDGGGVDAADGGDGGSRRDRTPPSDAAVCYRPQGYISDVPECASTMLCLDSPQTTIIDSSQCAGPECRWTYAVNMGDTLAYDGGDVWVFLRFKTPIAGATTTEDLTAAFYHVNFHQKFSTEGLAPPPDAVYFESRGGIEAFETLALTNGRLHVRLVFTIQEPYARIKSSDERCWNEHVLGQCLCRYGDVNVPGVIDIDLPADIPTKV